MTYQQMKGYNLGVVSAYDNAIIAFKEWGKATGRKTISIEELCQTLQAAKEFRNYQIERENQRLNSERER
jgi:hypothetical protein